ncbi:beta-glucosidase [Pelagibacterium halotolerans]|uniref:Beta-D-glucoside glucohydrolase n=1 Tax=Pelagibacterium halotolerans (strain DSM 22347 / JCM 15775 / CGMCC 1.7692 / B2) TaxID=1082931 RepID=G4R7D6_PELHB|nr:glycoside hydrolase family 3 C-terminal domain-containing protein [Pelagibacterium halotolerans]AEQ51272.1 beta-glucosidase [Pelagibacterium halotolerans B2]QJR18871.1 beta-glucosidase [Pelagibacterium halotolerans]SEA66750.1 beta-glucosidase [Pelagibacterium halotolerans]
MTLHTPQQTTVDALLDQMTLQEQVSLLSGADFWSLPAVERLGIGALRVTDGPNGARGGGSLIGGVKSASFPVGIALGATWNVALLAEIGRALAEETQSKGAHMLLAPTVNIQRSVTNGRNFECYSEDPILTGELAAAYIAGLQEQGIAATVKHFAGNESEIERTTMSSKIDERALREVYLIPFEYAVKKGRTLGVMTAYNRVNGTYASEHEWLISDVLRKQWGFDGLVMSDWFGSHSTAQTVNAGLDLEMPGPTRDRGEKLIAAVEAGEVARDTIRARTKAILTVMERTGTLNDQRERIERADDRPAHRALIRRAGAEAMVLLKNDGVLPLSGNDTIAVIGPNARTAQIMGGGSAQLNPHYRVSPWEGLVAALGEERLSYAQGCTNFRFEPLLETELTVDYFDNTALSGAPEHSETFGEAQAFWVGHVAAGKVTPDAFSARLSGKFVPRTDGLHRVGIASAGLSRVYVDGKLVSDAWTDWRKGHTFFEEGCDEVIGEIELTAGVPVEIVIEFATKAYSSLGISAFRMGISAPLGKEAIAHAASLAAKSDIALVFVGRNGEWDTEGSDLESISLPGRQDELVAAVAGANPRTIVVLQTGGPVEMPWLDDVAGVVQAWYPGQEAGNAIADVLLGRAEPGGRLSQSFPVKWSDNPAHSQDRKVYPGLDGEVEYREGVFVGYRHYDKHGISPLFPFGFGLSYTEFALSGHTIADATFENDGKVAVDISVANVGQRSGSTVVQLYVAPRDAPVDRPEKELKAFAKVHLEAGQSRTVRLELDARAFAHFDTGRGLWIVSPGRYDIAIGTDAKQMRPTGSVERIGELALAP